MPILREMVGLTADEVARKARAQMPRQPAWTNGKGLGAAEKLTAGVGA